VDKIHPQANLTATIIKLQKEEEEAGKRRVAQQKALFEKYGGQEYEKKPTIDATVIVSEHFVEYDDSGGIKGAPKIKPKSKYTEDVIINNHTSAWGSWWKNFKWGYVCCHSTVRNSYCTGEEGKLASEEAERKRTGADLDDVPHANESEVVSREETLQSDMEDDRKVKRDVAGVERRKRSFKEMQSGVSEEDMEEYRRKKLNVADLMAKHLGKDELVP
jgi:pre-mRNA-processing factor SLU7